MKKALSILLILALVTSCVRHERISSEVGALHSSEELELGAQIHRKILDSFQIYTESILNVYVNEIGNKVAEKAERKDLRYTFVILDDDRIYATHAPGGFVYITIGFFVFLVSEIELAGVLAHEIGALQYKDPELSKAKRAFDRLLQVGSYIGPAFGSIGALSLMGLMLAGLAVGRERSLEDQVYDADKKALSYMVDSGFDPQGLINPLRRMQDPDPRFKPYLFDYLQSHPVNAERFAKLEKEFGRLPI